MSADQPTVIEATPDDVAALLTARTKDQAGRELGVFNDDTRPTYEQVLTRIEIARELVFAGLGPVPDACRSTGEAVVALRAAMLTEAGFWPEQTQSNQSTYERLREMYLEARAGLIECTGGGLAGGTGAFDLDVSGVGRECRPIDWWQRDLDNPIAARDALRGG